MFRKPKKSKKKIGIRRRRLPSEDDSADDVDGNSEEIQDALDLKVDDSSDIIGDDDEGARKTVELRRARKKLKTTRKTNNGEGNIAMNKGSALLHHFQPSDSSRPSQKDLATSTNQHHPTSTKERTNKLLAGPIRASSNIRTTCRFDYQPDICKDYKDTGFCGFGDSCIYLHDRGDQLSGWQLEQKWEEEQKKKKDAQQKQLELFLRQSEGAEEKNNDNHRTDDGLPFACHICRSFFKNPVKTNCGHYFCEKCLLEYMKTNGTMCPICSKDTAGVYHEPAKLLSKRRRILGRNASWEDFMVHFLGHARKLDS